VAEPSSNNCLYCKVVTLRTSRARIRIHRVVNAKMYYSTQRQGETFSRSCPRTDEQRRATSQPSTNTAKPRVLDAGCTRSTSSPARGGARRGRSQPAAPRWVCYVAITARPAGPSMSLALILPLVVRTSVPAGLSARHDDAVRLRRARAGGPTYGTTITTSMHTVVAASRLHPERAHHMGRHELLLLVVTRSESPLPRDKWWSVLPSEAKSLAIRSAGLTVWRRKAGALRASRQIWLDILCAPACPLVCASSWSVLRS
jgi:hypothetical protein